MSHWLLKADPTLAAMAVCQRGSRLSVHPVAASHFTRVCQLGGWDGIGSQAAAPLVPTPDGAL